MGGLTVEERNLLSVAYKNVVGSRRASWRVLSSIEGKELEKGGNENSAIVKDYRAKVEDELSEICSDILSTLSDHLIPTAQKENELEAKVFYQKMKGDYHRYRAEYTVGEAREEAS